MKKRKSQLSSFSVLLFSLFSIYFFCRTINAKTPDESQDLLITETRWLDENEMRQRMTEYAKEKFSHNYHLTQNFNSKKVLIKGSLDDSSPKLSYIKKRQKRDFGIVSGPVSMAVLSGIIGMTARAVSDLTAYQSPPSEGGCKWFGTAPFCNYHCPSEFDYIRDNNGRCSSQWFALMCIPDDSFGEPCSTIAGAFFKKRFCCKSDPNECTWAGRWMGANTAHNIYCRYDNTQGRCGELSCSINHFDHKAKDIAQIEGQRCDQLKLFNLTGHATCGFIAWFNEENELVNSWYKTRG